MGTDAGTITVRFNDAINARDVGALGALMTQDHTFVDSAGDAIEGRQACLDAWRGFFGQFPDYRNVFTSVQADGEVVTVLGHSQCSDPALAGPARWTATIRDDLVAVWHVEDE